MYVILGKYLKLIDNGLYILFQTGTIEEYEMQLQAYKSGLTNSVVEIGEINQCFNKRKEDHMFNLDVKSILCYMTSRSHILL